MTRKKVDDNHKQIVEEYRRLGFSVVSTAAVHKGFPDLVVGAYGVTDLVEVKDGSKVPSKRHLTKDQQAFFENWRGSVRVVETLEDVRIHDEELKESFF